jgi:type I restriction enzyme S subunit
MTPRGIHPPFTHHLLRSYPFQEEFYRYGKGIVADLWSTNVSEMRNILIPHAPITEQEKISAFLDHETAKIDALIEKQQRLIELLKEKRQAVISHAVTKGLNPNAPMKDSGVEWLGEVPAHWEIRAVSKLSEKITNGYVGPTRDILVAEGVPYIQATHIKKGKVNFDGAYFVRTAWSNQHSKSILQNGDVLIVQTGAGTGDIGLVTDAEAGFNCHALIIVQPNQNVVSGEFLSMLFQSQYGYSVLYSIRTGGMHPHLNCGEVQYVRFPVPPRVEQAEILAFISSKTKTFDALINSQNTAIELMQERRTALISAAVTGKIDVRDWQAAA